MSEGTELAHVDDRARGVAVRSESGNIVAMLLEAARDPAIDAGKVETMANLAMKMQDRELEAEFNRDFNAAIMEMPVITKAGIITIPAKDGKPERTQGRFARFEDIDRVVRPILRRHNLAIRFEIGENNQNLTVRPVISHANGHTERGDTMRLPLDTSGAKNNVQGAGSAATYGKRYTMCAFLNIVTEGTDDDGSLGKFAIEMTHEREVTVLEQAEEAHANGTYTAFFNSQSPKDRAWLITSKHHERLGGAPALPDATRANAPAGGGGGDTPKHDTTTAKGWTDQYVEDCEAAGDLASLAEIQRRGKRALDRLAREDADLHKRATDADQAAFKRLSGDDL